MKKSQRHQVKSKFYYIFWGTATVVVLGQLYVGTGYRILHGGIQDLLDKLMEFFFKDGTPYGDML